jgi:exopolysaccharide production protein ExoY
MPGFQKSGELICDLFDPLPVVELIPIPPYDILWQEPQFSRLYLIVKRLIDILGALIGLMLLALLLPVLALLIKNEDAGPVFYKQVRVGRHGQAFSLYKLRTMLVDADAYLVRYPELLSAWQKNGKLDADPRITRIGRFLRRTSLDELPQLWNVLCGEMSLVGPRAIQFSEVAIFHELLEMRQQVKPGLTGLWQVSGRSTTSYEQRNVLDCTYVMECSLWMDITILCKTLPVVFYHIGAY